MGTPRTILIVGSTPLASFLTKHLKDAGHCVTVVDRKGADFSAFPDAMSDVCIEGDPLHESVLRRAKIDEADFMIGASPHDDLNLLMAIVCRKAFHIEGAIAVVHDLRKAEDFGAFGVEVVCTTTLTGSAILRAIDASGGEQLPQQSAFEARP